MESPESSYREYPIRCKTCNAQIACYAQEYEAAVKKNEQNETIEKTLNNLGIGNYCCRIALMNPTIVFFNMENRELIEGLKNSEEVRGPSVNNTGNSISIFKTCRLEKQIQTNLPPVAAGLVKPSESIFQRAAVPVAPSKQSAIAPLLPIDGPSAFAEGMPLPLAAVQVEAKKFIEPTVTGVSVINESMYRTADVYVGAAKYSTVLPGRTYLAR